MTIVTDKHIGQPVKVFDRRDGAVIFTGVLTACVVDIDDRAKDTATVRGTYAENPNGPASNIRVPRLCVEPDGEAPAPKPDTARYLQFCGAFNGKVKMFAGETPEAARDRAERLMQTALETRVSLIDIAVGVDTDVGVVDAAGKEVA
jgi:hypothetical protein